MHLYRLCGEVNDAQTMLEQMPRRTVVSWNTLLVFYTGRLMMGEAMKLFGQMRDNGCEFYQTTNIILPSMSDLTWRLGFGRWIHYQIIFREIEVSIKLDTTLVHMYAKCRSINTAIVVFHIMSIKNVSLDLISLVSLKLLLIYSIG
ncbi:Pentatricopeptide repeat-containing protein [Platanthera guangdongensis]|uniref:Pentatricopeptide repeat-containing protein n=1 Tax=Platanthera guangdongensis TaxID=2320717 RepID=A0ABR2LLA3_9ASPA